MEEGREKYRSNGQEIRKRNKVEKAKE